MGATDGIYDELDNEEFEEKVTLQPFHPEHLRARSLAEDIRVGSIVQSHYAIDDFVGGAKSEDTVPVTVVSTDLSSVVGVRTVGVRFLHDGREEEVPIEWLTSSLGPP